MTADRPVGPEAVRAALVTATAGLIVEKGLALSVREIASRARVNHGLVHTYFGNKDELLQAAFDEINRRAAAELDASGYPPPDLAERRDGELARALARVMLDDGQVPTTSHPVVSTWQQALRRDHPEWSPDAVDEGVAVASTLALGWTLFADHLAAILDLDDVRRKEVGERISALVAEFGGIPTGR